jgi:hypothetical protein
MAERIAKIGAESVGAVSLKSVATKNKITDTVVPIWELATTSSQVPEKAECFLAVNGKAESVIDHDERVLVGPEHFAPGGKYRCK